MTRTAPSPVTQALRWALDDSHDPSMASADWLAHDIDARYDSIVALLVVLGASYIVGRTHPAVAPSKSRRPGPGVQWPSAAVSAAASTSQ